VGSVTLLDLRAPATFAGVSANESVPRSLLVAVYALRKEDAMTEPTEPTELRPKILWWDCGCGFDCVCGAKDFTLSDEQSVTCDQCGRVWNLHTELQCADATVRLERD
jgi:hypothetical protein